MHKTQLPSPSARRRGSPPGLGCAGCRQQRRDSFLTCPEAEPLIIFICIGRNIFGAISAASPFKKAPGGFPAPSGRRLSSLQFGRFHLTAASNGGSVSGWGCAIRGGIQSASVTLPRAQTEALAGWPQGLSCGPAPHGAPGSSPKSPTNPLYLPKASCKYFCPTSFRYSSIALVASVFSLKMRCSFSPQRSTSDIIRSVKKSWKAKPTVGHQVSRSLCAAGQAALPCARRTAASLTSLLLLQPSQRREEKSISGEFQLLHPKMIHSTPAPHLSPHHLQLSGGAHLSLMFWG